MVISLTIALAITTMEMSRNLPNKLGGLSKFNWITWEVWWILSVRSSRVFWPSYGACVVDVKAIAETELPLLLLILLLFLLLPLLLLLLLLTSSFVLPFSTCMAIQHPSELLNRLQRLGDGPAIYLTRHPPPSTSFTSSIFWFVCLFVYLMILLLKTFRN